MSRAKRALVVVNRHASRAEAAIDRVEAVLAGAGMEVDLRVPDDPTAIPEVVRGSASGASCVVLAGGDGTLHHAVPALREAGLPLGILPLGTANDLARTLGLPLDPEKAARVIAGGCTRWIDLGRAGDEWFLNVASFGITGRVTRRVDGSQKRLLGALTYPIRALLALREARRFTVTLDLAGERRRLRALQVAVGNGRCYGGGMAFDADAEIDDGQLAIVVVRAESLWKLAALAPRLVRGTARRSPNAVVLRRALRVLVGGETA